MKTDKELRKEAAIYTVIFVGIMALFVLLMFVLVSISPVLFLTLVLVTIVGLFLAALYESFYRGLKSDNRE